MLNHSSAASATSDQPESTVSEWPRKAAGLLPEPDLRIELGVLDDDQRAVRYEAMTPLGRELLDA